MRVLLVSPFGEPAYGISPYSDALLASLRQSQGCAARNSVQSLDFQSAYPHFLYPAKMPSRQRSAGIHWAKPWSWDYIGPQPDIVHIQYWTQVTAPYLLQFAKRLRKRGAKIAITVHNLRPHESSGSLGYFEHRLLDSAHAVITHLESHATKTQFGPRHHLVPHGIQFQNRTHATKEDYRLTGLRPDRRYCLYFGNIRPYKGALDLLKAWKLLTPDFPDHELIIAGRVWSGSTFSSRLAGTFLGLNRFEKEFHQMQSDLSRKFVRFFNHYLSEDFIDACCRVADLAVFPYQHFDAQSGAASRVAGFGRRLLVSRTGGLPALTHDDRYVFNPGDVEDLRMKLNSLMSDSREKVLEDEAKQMDYLRPYSWSSVAAKHWEIYTEMLSTP